MNPSPFDLDRPGTPAPNICLHLFGPPTIEINHSIQEFPRQSVRALLYRLASDPQPVCRAHLHFLFWPDLPEQVARRNLTHHLTHLRRALPLLPIQTDSSSWIRLDPDRVRCDVIDLQNGVSRFPHDPSELLNLASLYTGPFLEGFDLPRHPLFEQWCLMKRSLLERQSLKILEQLVERLIACHDIHQALHYAQRYLAIDPLSEAMHRRLISLYGAAGERHLALQQFQHCCAILKTELGIRPLPQTIEVYQAVLDGRSMFPDQPLLPT